MCLMVFGGWVLALPLERGVRGLAFLPMVLVAAQPDLGTAMTIVPVTLGNIVGGSALVALVYWIAYLRKDG